MSTRLLFAAFCIFVSINCPSSADPEAAKADTFVSEVALANPEGKGILRVEFKVSGTDCPICLGRIQSKLAAVKGVQKAVVWPWAPYFGLVIYDSDRISWKDVEKSIEDEHVKFVEITQLKQPKEQKK